jgi:hypothetical protein
MMTLSRRYLVASFVAASLIIAYYLYYAASLPGPPSGRTPQGLGLGILGFAAMVGALLYSLRRRFLAKAMWPITVSAEIRMDLKAREQRAMQQLQLLQQQVLRNPHLEPAQLRRQAKQILKDNKVTRYIRVQILGGGRQPARLAIERREWTGQLRVWYCWHLMLGCLSVLLIATHAGFRFSNPVAVLAFLFLVGVVATGVLGYAIYKVVPPALTKVEQRVEKTPEELREERDEVRRELEAVTQGKSPSFLAIYQQEAAIPDVSLTPSWRWLLGPAEVARDTTRPDRLRLIVREIPGPEQEDFRKMVRLLFQKESLEVSLYPQLRYDYLLKIWLGLHIPLTAGLMVFSLIHILSVLYY